MLKKKKKKKKTVLSHFQFGERFYVNTFYGEQFHENIWRRQELNVLKYPIKEEF